MEIAHITDFSRLKIILDFLSINLKADICLTDNNISRILYRSDKKRQIFRKMNLFMN